MSARPVLRGLHAAFFAALLVVAAAVLGCGGSGKSTAPDTSSNPAAALVVQANAKLADVLFAQLNAPDPDRPSDVDFSEPLGLYSQALAADPMNRDANFGVGVLRLLALSVDAEVNDAFDEWSAYLASHTPFEARASQRRPLGVPLFFPDAGSGMKLPWGIVPLSVLAQQRGVLGGPDPQISRIQDILRLRVLPRLVEARTRLLVAGTPGYQFWVTPRMQGDPGADSVEIDQTDLLVLASAAGLLEALCHTAVAYELGMSAYDSLSLHQAIQPGSGWLALATGGAGHVQATDDAMLGAANTLDLAITALLAETDPQDNDVIRRGPAWVGTAEAESLRTQLDHVRAAFGAQGFTLVEDWDGNSGTPDVPLTIRLGAWFTNPVSDLKSLLPGYTGRVVRRPRQVYWDYFYAQGTLEAMVPVQGFYSVDLTLQLAHHDTVSSSESGYATLRTAARAEMANRIAELEANPEWTGDFYGVVSANGLATSSGLQSFSMSFSSTFGLASEFTFVPVIRWDAATFQTWTWPDPTLHGVLPGMSSTAQLLQTFGVEEAQWEQENVLDWTGGSPFAASRPRPAAFTGARRSAIPAAGLRRDRPATVRLPIATARARR